MASQSNKLPPGARPKTTSASRPRGDGRGPHGSNSQRGPASTRGSRSNRNNPTQPLRPRNADTKSSFAPSGKAHNQEDRNRNKSNNTNWRKENIDNKNKNDDNRRGAWSRGRGRPGNRSFDRSQDRPGRRDRPLDVKRLKEMLNKEPTEIVMELATERSGWREFLDKSDIPRDIVVVLLEIMAKACLCRGSPKNLNSFLAFVCQSAFLSRHLSPFISKLSSVGSMSSDVASDDDLQPGENIVKLLHTILQCLQTFALDDVKVNAFLLECVYKGNDKIPTEVKKRVTQLNQMCEDLQKSRENFNDRAMVKSQYKPPPNDFRGIQIIPDINEIGKIKRPYLRHNLIKGKYDDAEHYLDVQFRLLREDFVAPLREGVGEYLESKEEFKHNPRRRLQDVRLYHGVKIVRPVMTREGTGHLIKFDTSPFKKIRWESSKRLISGSLLCLTKDNFETVIFATVEERDVRQLQRGEIEVKFIRLDDAIGKAASEATFLMAETSAYFESYRHVLGGLKEYTEASLPMKPYIVKASGVANPPTYLQGVTDSEPLYDLRLTSQRLTDDDDDTSSNKPDSESASVVNEGTEDSDSDTSFITVLRSNENDADSDLIDFRLHNYMQGKLRAVNVLEQSTWPDANTLHFDESQLEAFRAAVTNEFVLIQGPPGTGKTYVGLEIVKTLLFNCHAWCRGEAEEDWDFRPILVVCYTNHALDQFLEGIYRYEKDIVRVGGRCKSESLQECCIFNVRQAMKKSRHVPEHIRRRRSDMKEYYDMRNILVAAHERIALAQTGVLDPTTLFSRQIIYQEQYRSLMSCNNDNPIGVWLGLDGKGLPKVPSRRRINNDEEEENEGEEEEVEDQVDIAEEAALLAEQRELGNDPTFLKYREESQANLKSEFCFLPRKRFTGETMKQKQERLKIERSIEYAINDTYIMGREDADSVVDVWQLTYPERWSLYRSWLKRYIESQERIMLQYQTAYEQLSQERKEIDREEDYLILKHAKVIGFTTTGAAKHRALLQRLRPRIIVVEEAAEVLEAHIITTLSQDCQHLILIGDHQQLRPNPTVYRLAKDFHLDVSLFERMIINGMPCYRLGQQHRMRPDISILMKEHFYKGLQDHTSVTSFRSVKGVTKNMFFLEHDHKELKIEDNKSKSNLHEAKFLIELCYYFLQQGYEPSQITILTTYTGQLFNFKRLMNKEKFEGVRVSVVDNFQGEENEIILLSLVRSNDEGSIGFLNVHNRVCVALSRARRGLFCIGNIRLLAARSPLWKKIMKTTTINNQIGQKIPLACQNHPETVTEVSSPEEFSKLVPDGGCSRKCDARLECGHACRLHCHPKDPEHKAYECLKDCSTICPRGHMCSLRCYQECRCQVLLTKLFAKCQHTGKVKCHEDETAICQRPCSVKLACKHDCPAKCGEECPKMCLEKCPKKLKCGHNCKRKCGRPCSTTAECKIKVEVKQPNCGHPYWVDCKDDPRWRSLPRHPPCNARCTRNMKCGHRCNNLCREKCQTECLQVVNKTWPTCDHSTPVICKDAKDTVCTEMIMKTWPSCNHQSQMLCCDAQSVLCWKACLKLLPCGHRCTKACKDPCEPTKCNLPCKRILLKCGHTCRNKCNEPCDVTTCTSPCKQLLSCKHQCQKKCNELCDDTTCILPCKRLLECGHQCQKSCNEPCETHCSRQMLKRMPCGHHTEVPCCVDVDKVDCFKKCLEILLCGHRCQNRCGVPCTVACQENQEKILPKCGHKVTIPCDKEPNQSMCTDKCETKLKCGHLCQRLCREECEDKCRAIVSKEFPKCKHKCKLPCLQDPETVKCSTPCAITLPCKHKCAEKCSDPCTSQCRERVTRKHPTCGHFLTMLCYEDISMKICRNPCRATLPCGHNCPKMCFEPCKMSEVTSEANTCKDEARSLFFDLYNRITKWPVCQKRVQKEAKCGHKVECRCCDDPDSIQCLSRCTKYLQCTHQCAAACSERCETFQCDVIKSKRIPRCGHIVNIKCHEDPTLVICQEPCARKLPCGHTCPKRCSEECVILGDLCKELVTKKLPGCNHDKKLQCHEDPASVSCTNICTKQLKCGHNCRSTCHPSSQQCETNCRVKVHKTITQCRHTVKLPCHLDPDSGLYCVKKCEKRLDCGHDCKERCGRPCTKLCKERLKTGKVLPCKHVARDIACSDIPSEVFCREQCTNRLGCGHECKNVCGECVHRVEGRGSKSPTCAEVCGKLLLCGHQCQSRCRDCYGGRLHQHCKIRIDNVLLLCGCTVKEECSRLLLIRHTPRIRSCLLQQRRIYRKKKTQGDCKHNPSDDYCDNPCTKLLPCNKHTCIGICGEPCIKLCRFCNRREVLKIFPEFRANKDPCYIQLNECHEKHIFEIDDLKKRLGMVLQSSECGPILPVTCPRCGTAICEKRFEKHSAEVTKSVQSIHERLQRETSSKLKKAEELLKRSQYTHTTQMRMQAIPMRRRGGGYQGGTKTRQTVTRKAETDMTWKLKLLDIIDQIYPTTPVSHLRAEHEHLIRRCKNMQTAVLQEIRTRLEKLLDERTYLTEQLATDLGCEFERLQWCCGLEKLAKNSAEDETSFFRRTLRIGFGDLGSNWACVQMAVDIITSPRPFTLQRRNEATEALGTSLHDQLVTILKTEHAYTYLGRELVFDMQRAQLGFLAGDWFRCSNNHIFHSRAHIGRGHSTSDCTLSCPICG